MNEKHAQQRVVLFIPQHRYGVKHAAMFIAIPASDITVDVGRLITSSLFWTSPVKLSGDDSGIVHCSINLLGRQATNDVRWSHFQYFFRNGTKVSGGTGIDVVNTEIVVRKYHGPQIVEV